MADTFRLLGKALSGEPMSDEEASAWEKAKKDPALGAVDFRRFSGAPSQERASTFQAGFGEQREMGSMAPQGVPIDNTVGPVRGSTGVASTPYIPGSTRPTRTVLDIESTRQPSPGAATMKTGAFNQAGESIQRGQASAGSLGATTGDFSGTGAGGTSSTMQGSDPFQQLAALRSLGPVGGERSGSKVSFIPNTYARERNARLDDPLRKLAANIDLQVRRGAMAPAKGAEILENLAKTGTQRDISQAEIQEKRRSSLAGEDISRRGQDITAEGQSLGFQKSQSEQALAGAKLAESMRETNLMASEKERDRALKEARFGFDKEDAAQRQSLGERRYEEDIRSRQGQEMLARLGLDLRGEAGRTQAIKLLQDLYSFESNIPEETRNLLASGLINRISPPKVVPPKTTEE